jgi:branched-chain amino acid transport system substrate-binding protein
MRMKHILSIAFGDQARRSSLHRCLLGFAIVLASIVAWSSSGGAGFSGTTAAAATTQSTIKLAQVLDLTGAGTTDIASNYQDAANAWVKWVNKHGGLSGHPVKLYQYDDQGDPANAISYVKNAVQNLHVVAFFAMESSATEESFADYLLANRIPVIGGNVATSVWTTHWNYFPAQTSESTNLGLQLTILKNAGVKKVGSPYCIEVSACGQAIPLEKTAAQKLGQNFVWSEGVSSSAPSYTAPCLAEQQAGVTGSTLDVGGAAAQQYVASCAMQHYTPTYATGASTAIASWLQTPAMNKLYVVAQDFPWVVKSSATKTFRAAMAKGNTPNGPVSGQYADTWLAGLMLQHAVAVAAKTGPTISSEGILNGLWTIKNGTWGGLSPPMSFTKQQNTPVTTKNWLGCAYSMQIKFANGASSGVWTAPNGLKYVCAP